MTIRFLIGDCRSVLKTLADCSVQTAISSPPYFGLRDYGADGQIGVEETPGEYVSQLVDVFREVRRVLRDDGTLWLNLGDSYVRSGGTSDGDARALVHLNGKQRRMTAVPEGLKAKDLCGIPWRVAFALQADGWWLRQDIVWSKPNPMPEAVTDRCTKSHEFIFLLTKSPIYFFDAEAISEDVVKTGTPAHLAAGKGSYQNERHSPQYLGRKSATKHELSADRKRNGEDGSPQSFRAIRTKRNKRDVWTVAVRPFLDAHFATFPPELIEPCVMAGSSEKGACELCGAPWRRTVEHGEKEKITTGWEATCGCGVEGVVPCVVLDPFGGAGTSGLVADRLGRDAVLIELNPEYVAMAQQRVVGDSPLFVKVAAQ